MEENMNLDDNISYREEADNSRINIVDNEKHGSVVGYCETFRRRYLQSTLFQLVVFICFLIVLSFVTFGTTSKARYYMTKAIQATFLQRLFGRGIFFHEILSAQDIWMFLEEVALPQLFPQPDDYDNDNYTAFRFRYVLNENLILGIPRLKQIRVRNDSCRVHDDFRAIVSVCYSAYSEEAEDRRPFGVQNGTAWVYSSEKDLNSLPFWGQISTYGGGGSYEDFGTGFQDPFKQLNFLRENSWIDVSTRIVALDFTLYNDNVNLFSVVKLMLEFPAGGGVWPFVSIRTVNLLRYITSWDYFILVIEFVFCGFTLYYLVVEIIEISSNGLRYFMFKWNLVDFVILLLSIICVGFGIYRTVLLDKLLKLVNANPDAFHNFEHLGFWQTLYDASTGVLVFLAWIKIFKYLSFNETMIQLSTTLAKCAKDVGGFALMFLIIFLAYAQLGYLLFGPLLKNFSRIETSIFTLMRLILGDFDYVAIERANRIMGPLFFVTFVFFVFIILLNMFLAILSDTYTQIKTKSDAKSYNEGLKFGNMLNVIFSKFQQLLKKTKLIKNTSENVEEIRPVKSFQTSKTDGAASDQQRNVNDKFSEAVNNNKNNIIEGVSLEDFENLSIRMDDLRHEMDQIQLAILTKMTVISQNVDKLTDLFPTV